MGRTRRKHDQLQLFPVPAADRSGRQELHVEYVQEQLFHEVRAHTRVLKGKPVTVAAHMRRATTTYRLAQEQDD